MLSMFIFGISGGVVAAWFAWPFGLLAAMGAYVFGGALSALLPALVEWRIEVVRGRNERRAAISRSSSRLPAPARHTCRQ